MSSIVIAGDTSGSVTLQAPATAGSTVLTLPSTTGTVMAPTSSGTAGQVLTSSGSATPTWTSPSAGAMTFISVQTVSGTPSTLDFTSGISATYDDYMVIFEDVAMSGTTTLLLFQFYKSGAFQTSTYRSNYIYAAGNSTSVFSTAVTSDGFVITRQSSTTAANLRSGTINIYNLNSATAYAASCTYMGQNHGSSATGLDNTLTFGGGSQGTAAAVTQLRFTPSGGATFTSGTFRLYGIQKS